MNATYRRGAALLCAPLLALSGCMVGPNYHTPNVPTPPAFKEAAPPAGTATLGGAAWWSVFDDQTLNGLEQQAMAANQDIAIGVARIDQADAFRRTLHSQQLPQISTNPSVSRTREAQLRPNNGNTAGRAATFNDYTAPLTLSYEVDAWGRIRRMVASAADAQQATVADLRFIQLNVTTNVATSYYFLHEADAETAVLESTLADLRRGYDITQNQFHHGLVSELPGVQAKTVLDQTEAHIATLHTQRALAEHAIAVLLGRTVEGFSVPVAVLTGPPPVIPAGMPADLLQRRPDVREAERNAAAASQQIGIAKAAYYPQIALTGYAGYETTNIASLVNWQNTIANLAASVTAPIFTGGRLKAGVDQAKAVYRQSALQYGQTVLIAYQEVEDQLASLHDLTNEYQSEQSAIADATRAEQIANDQYKVGLVSYLDVVYAEQALLLNQETETQVQNQRFTATISLVRALGGSW